MQIPVLHQDESLVVVSKPPGVFVHRTREGPDREVLLQALGAQLGRFLYPVHRLDRATSGAIAFALTSEDARRLHEAIESGEALKEYLVLARGSTPEAFTVDRPLKNDRGVAQDARTEFQRVAELSRCTLLRARLFTGRRHQIRRHLSRLAHQVLGDSTYGKGGWNRFFRETYGLPRLFLHAWVLELPHPRKGERLRVRAPLADDLRAFLSRLPDAPPGLIDSLG